MTPNPQPLSEDDFTRLESLFASLVPLDVEARSRALRDACDGRPDLQLQLETLLAAHDRLGADEEEVTDSSGMLVGAYRLVEKIGEGGMGDVYRAERADGLFEQQVAVKITRSAIADSDLRRRFVIERQILATLNHENIVRLLDGGTTSSGHAFLIMEYVEGVPLTQHCRDGRLVLEDRVRLLSDVCKAVQYAHQRGVVHRDLKPANILVTPGHTPKVLDFGIAKLLEAQRGTGLTTTNLIPGPLTPNYASPEQIRGLPVTTASDVYALGVILYEIVAGARPYDTQDLPLERVIDVVLNRDPQRPSAAAAAATDLPYPPSRLAGDLDAIVLRAMSKNPADRYDSAAELAADLTRWLDGRPVVARTSSTAYVLRRIAGRHKRVVAASVAALLAIVAASGVAFWQWQVARREQLRSEARFNDVRRLANAVIFKIHDAVMPLPGSTPVRRIIVDEAIGYLERLEAESGHDPALVLELAAAHRQIAAILGNVSIANLGDRAGAIAQYQRARSMVQPMLTPSASYDAVLALVEADLRLSSLQIAAGDGAAALSLAKEAVDYASKYYERNPGDRRGADLQARAYFGLAQTAPREERVALWYQTLDYYEKLLSIQPDDAQTQRNVGLVGKYLGGHLEAGDPERARVHYMRALELDQRRLDAAPDDTRVQFDAAISYSNVASVSERLGDLEGAARDFERSLTLRRKLAEGDPNNVQARGRLAYLLARIGRFHLTRSPEQSISYSREAIEVIGADASTLVDVSNQHIVARSWYQIGYAEAQLKHQARACAAFTQAHKAYTAIVKGFDSSEKNNASYAARQAAACGGGSR